MAKTGTNREGVLTRPPTRPAPALLVSVRNESEARDALAGGAAVIDIKEPAEGPLGAASLPVISRVVKTLAGAALVTVATGELGDAFPAQQLPSGVAIAKLGLAGAANRAWRDEARQWAARLPGPVGGALVAYADWQAARSPHPEDVLEQAVAMGCRGFVVDTWSKGGPCSLDRLPEDRLRALIDAAIEHRLTVVLAGSITAERAAEAAALRPTLVGVRGAACVGGRSGPIDRGRVRAMVRTLDACRRDG